MKKGVIDQVFIYIFVIIVIALVLLFGFKQVTNLKNLSEKTTYTVFREDFKKAVNDIYYKNEGSAVVFSKISKNKPLSLPSEIKKVCFENEKVVINSEKYYNFTVDNLITSVDCINVNNELSFKLENVVENREVKIRISDVGTQ